jgi:hypothetical protein
MFTEMGVATRRLYFKNTVINRKDGNIMCSQNVIARLFILASCAFTQVQTISSLIKSARDSWIGCHTLARLGY